MNIINWSGQTHTNLGGQHLPQDHRVRPHIGTLGEKIAADHLRCHPRKRAGRAHLRGVLMLKEERLSILRVNHRRKLAKYEIEEQFL